MKKRILSFVLMLSLLVGMLSVFATGVAAQGDGTASGILPYAQREAGSGSSSVKEGGDEERTGGGAIEPSAFDIDNTLYVTEGLKVLLVSYAALQTPTTVAGSDSLLWQNALDEDGFANLYGTGWTVNANGGITLVKTLDDYIPPNQNTSLYTSVEDYAIILDGSMLPQDDYTVEYVANPVGITNENGGHYIDLESKHGIFHDNSLAIGPLRALQFSAMRSSEGSFTRWWRYSSSAQPHSTDPWPPNFWYEDTTWVNVGLEDVITTSITLDTSSGNHTYNIYTDTASVYVKTIQSSQVITPQQTNNIFRLMGGMAGTVYAIRVYDRVLNEDEMAQNHFADLAYYYGVDIRSLKGAMDAMGGPSAIAAAFSDIGFDMDREEALALFDSRLTGIWLSYEGFGVRKDLRDGMRFYFDINPQGIRAMEVAGATVEIGAIVSIGKNAQPVLDGYGYDYKIVAYDSVMGLEDIFYTDEDTFAVTVRYASPNRETLLKDVLCRGYVKMTFEDGSYLLYYTSDTEKAPKDLFECYSTLKREKNPALDENAAFKEHMSACIESCYTDEYIYLDAAANEGGNGSKEQPYKYFEDAFGRAKELLGALDAPLHLYISAANGIYSVTQVQTLTGADIAYDYFDLTVLCEDGNAVLTTTTAITGEFTAQENNIYAYQFEKDENGDYPSFRYLYVDGNRAELAHNAGKSAALGTMLRTGFDRSFDGVYATVLDMAKAGEIKNFTTMAPQYRGRTDLETIFRAYLPYAVAWCEVSEIYENLPQKSTSYASSGKALRDATPSKGSNITYKQAFQTYQTMYLARYEAECKARLLGFSGYDYYNAACSKTQKQDKLYYDTYQAAKNYIYTQAVNNGNNDIAVYEISMEQMDGYRGYDLKKFYLSETLLGGAVDIVRNGQEDVLAYAETLDPSADAILIAEMKHTYKWMHHALRGYDIQITLSLQYMQNTTKINGIDLDDYYVDENGEKHYACYFDEYERLQMPAGGNGYYTLADRYAVTSNAYCYLDTENEYYYNESTGTLYYYTENGTDGKSFARPTMDNLLKFENVGGLRFEGITFTGVDDYYLTENNHFGTQAAGDHNIGTTYAGGFPDRAAIYLKNVSDVSIKNCQFVELGCEGITARGWMTDIVIEECTFKNIGAAAMRFGENYREHEQQLWVDGAIGNKDIDILNNYLENISLDYLTPALQLTTCMNVNVKYNTVKNTAYTGISIGWTWGTPTVDRGYVTNLENVDISYNFISGFCNRGDDGGAIYVLGRPYSTIKEEDHTYINRMHHNYILYDRGTGDCKGGLNAGLYLDGSSSNWHVLKNVIVAPAYGAAEGETDYEKYGITAEIAERMQYNRELMIMIFPQWVSNQQARNILMEGNYLLGMRSEDEAEQYKEAFKVYMDKSLTGKEPEERGLILKDTTYVVGTSWIPSEAGRIIESCGSKGAKGIVSDIMDFIY